MIEELSPFSRDRREYNNWIKCESCYTSDNNFEIQAKKYDKDFNDEFYRLEYLQMKQYESVSKENSKRKRIEKKDKANKVMKAFEIATSPIKETLNKVLTDDIKTVSHPSIKNEIASDDINYRNNDDNIIKNDDKPDDIIDRTDGINSQLEIDLGIFMEKLKTAKLDKLKALCRSNHLMLSGNKTELIVRLVI